MKPWEREDLTVAEASPPKVALKPWERDDLQTREEFPTGEGEFATRGVSPDTSNSAAQYFKFTERGAELRAREAPEARTNRKKLANARVQLALARGVPEKEEAIARTLFEDAVIEKDADGNALISVPSLGIQRQFLNEPGLSIRDVDQTAVPLMAMAGPVKLAGLLRNVLARVPVTGAAAAAEVGIQDRAVEQLTDGAAPVDDTDAGVAFGLGAAFEAIPAPLINMVARMFRRSDGVVTPQLREALSRYDIDADSLTRDQVIAIQQLADQSPEQIRQRLTSDLGLEFGVRQTKADRTGNELDVVKEAEARLKSPDVFAEFDNKRSQDLIDATRDIQASRLNRGAAEVHSEVEAGERLREGFTRRKDTLEARVDAAYEEFGSKNAAMNAGAYSDFLKSQRGATINQRGDILIEAADLEAGDSLTPATKRVVEFMENQARFIDDARERFGSENVVATANELEKMRRRINLGLDKAERGTADFRFLTALKANFDRFVDDAVDRALFTGDADAIAAVKKARKLNAEYMAKFKNDDQAGKIIQKIVDENADDAMITRYIFGSAELGNVQGSLQTIRRIKEVVGDDSREWQALREAAFMRLVYPRTTGRSFDPAVFAKHMNEAMGGNGAKVLEELFNVDERAMLNRFRTLVQNTLPKDLKNGHRFAGRVREALETFVKMRGRGTVFKGEALKGTIIRIVPDLLRDFEAKRVINGRAAEGESLLVRALRPVVAVEATKDEANVFDD